MSSQTALIPQQTAQRQADSRNKQTRRSGKSQLMSDCYPWPHSDSLSLSLSARLSSSLSASSSLSLTRKTSALVFPRFRGESRLTQRVRFRPVTFLCVQSSVSSVLERYWPSSLDEMNSNVVMDRSATLCNNDNATQTVYELCVFPLQSFYVCATVCVCRTDLRAAIFFGQQKKITLLTTE